ncbi:hypothetical protein ANCCAN_29816, partial [Ancylostoma caninum]
MMGPRLATILRHPHGKVDDCDEAPMEEKRTTKLQGRKRTGADAGRRRATT